MVILIVQLFFEMVLKNRGQIDGEVRPFIDSPVEQTLKKNKIYRKFIIPSLINHH